MKNKLLNLEFIRGGAALLVVFGHLKKYIPALDSYNNHIIQLFLNWGAECVIMFFILSGIVVHYSYAQKPKSNITFLKHRIIRLHPTLFIALILSLMVEIFFFNNYPAFNTILGNFIPYSTMRDYLAPLLWNTNPAIWSLTFEVFFYFIFGLLIIKKYSINYKYINLWLCLSLTALFFYYHPTANIFLNHIVAMFAFSFIWLVGFYIYKLRDKIYTDTPIALISLSLLPIVSRLHLFPNYYDPIKYSLFSLTAAPFFLLLLNGESSKTYCIINKKYVYIFLTAIYISSAFTLLVDPTYITTSKVLYIALPIIIYCCTKITVALKHIKRIASDVIIPLFAFFGKYSYSIYLIHIPIILLISKTLKINIYGQIPIILTSIFCLSYLIECYLQPYINKKFL